ncbi:MAG: hypothetical protein ABIO51_05720 [Solirubrobacteraceae bacterium]
MAARSDYRPVPEMSVPARLARAFAYVLLVVTCTVIAALGGYQVGQRSSPSEANVAGERQAAVKSAVSKAVAAQAAKDRAARVAALRDLAAFQREKFGSELGSKVSQVRIAEAENAARAFRRGRAAGRAAAVRAAEAEAADAKPVSTTPKPADDAKPAGAADSQR